MNKKLWLMLLAGGVLASPIARAQPATVESALPLPPKGNLALSLSFPYLITLERTFAMDERSAIEAFAGGLPIASLLFLDTTLRDSGYSDTHKISYSLEAWNFSSGVRYSRQLSARWSVLGEVGLVFVQAGAQLHLKNTETGRKVPLMGISASLAQPIFGISLRRAWRSWALTLSVNSYLGTAIAFRQSGWLPSFQAVAPEYAAATAEGIDAVESALAAAMNNLKTRVNFLPGFSLSYRF